MALVKALVSLFDSSLLAWNLTCLLQKEGLRHSWLSRLRRLVKCIFALILLIPVIQVNDQA